MLALPTARSSRRVRASSALASLASVVVLSVAACSGTGAEGAPNPDGKGEGAACVADAECQSLVCAAGRCAPVGSEVPRCGAGRAAACSEGERCTSGGDCESGVCKGGACAPPAPDDGVKNGDETDIDCGGSRAPKCVVGRGCKAHEDCASDACSYAGECVAFKSCTGRFGGDTCGPGETGTPGAAHESCCATVETTGGTRIGKYHVTAGRMRAFVDRYAGDLVAWAATSPSGWDSAYDDQLPSSLDEALALLGPNGKQGCDPEAQGARTYFQGPIDGDPRRRSDFSKDALDEKALNCVTWHMAQALCVFDGGRLATTAELRDLITNGGKHEYPWQFHDASPYDIRVQDERVVNMYSYATPNPPATMRMDPEYPDTPLDRAFFIAPPGRRPAGESEHGAMDAVGNMLTWVSDSPRYFLYTGSWERHGLKAQPERWELNGTHAYYAVGARCAFP